MLSALNSIDHSWFLAIHHFRNGFLDVFMPWMSNRWIWIPLYAVLLFFVWKRFGRQTITIAITVALLLLATDQTANLLKNTVKRPRPCHDVMLMGEGVITPLGCGGEYGFVSGHASNCAAIALFLFLLSGRAHGFAPSASRRWWSALFLWMILVSWSRIYLGVHFPFDVICGMLLGFVYAIVFYIFYKKVMPVLR